MIDPIGLLTGIGIGVAAAVLIRRRRIETDGASAPVHPDDREAIAQAEARAFCSGVPQVVSYRRRDADGGWRWREYRADPPYSANVAVPPLVHAPDDAWTRAASLGETRDAVRAAKIIEDVYGSAFAFDAEGQFTYATPMAQASLVGSWTRWLTVNVAGSKNDVTMGVRAGALMAASTVRMARWRAESPAWAVMACHQRWMLI